MSAYGRHVAYQKTQVSTVNKSKLVVMMYEGAIRFIKEAQTEIQKKNIPGRGVSISKAQRVIDELQGSLNHEKGGEVAKNLSSVYVEVNRKLTAANINGDASLLDEALEMLNPIHEAWRKITSGNGAASAQAALKGEAPAPPAKGAIAFSA